MTLNEIMGGRYYDYYNGDDYLYLDGEFSIADLKKLVEYLEKNEKKHYIVNVKSDAPSHTNLDWILEAASKINGCEIYKKTAQNKVETILANKEQISCTLFWFGALIEIKEYSGEASDISVEV